MSGEPKIGVPCPNTDWAESVGHVLHHRLRLLRVQRVADHAVPVELHEACGEGGVRREEQDKPRQERQQLLHVVRGVVPQHVQQAWAGQPSAEKRGERYLSKNSTSVCYLQQNGIHTSFRILIPQNNTAKQ